MSTRASTSSLRRRSARASAPCSRGPVMRSRPSVAVMWSPAVRARPRRRSEEHTSELQSRPHLVCRLLLEKKKPSDSANEIRSFVPADVLGQLSTSYEVYTYTASQISSIALEQSNHKSYFSLSWQPSWIKL